MRVTHRLLLILSFAALSSLTGWTQNTSIVIPAGTPEDKDLATITAESDPQKRIAAYEQFLTKYADNKPATAYAEWQLSQIYLAAGDTAKAMDYGSKALEAYPNNLDIIMSQATIAQAMKDNSKVLDYAVQGATVYNSIAKQTKPADASDVASLFARVNTAAEAPQSSLTFSFEIPKSLQRERKQLHDELSRIAAERGSVGNAAQQVEQMLQAHCAHEEAFALPPLGLLPLLACGLAWSEMAPAVTMAARLKSSLPSMLEDHEAIVAALRAFERTAERAGRTELAPLARRLIEHAEMEAEVLYPASIVAGKLVESRLYGRRQGAS